MDKLTRKSFFELIFVVFCVVMSIWVMFSTFSYENGKMLIATKAWSDFASHIPLIRSFSLGENFPPQYALFAGPSIHYHFLFYFIVSLLEKIGINIAVALNILSSLGFFSLVMMLYFFTKKLFRSQAVGILTVMFFLFNGTMSFLYFFYDHPFSSHTFWDIITNTKFPSFGPYDDRLVSAFWNLNIYTNQRHLAPAYSFVFLLLYFFIFTIPHEKHTQKKYFLIIISGILYGISYFFHQAVFFMVGIVFSVLFMLVSKIQKLYIFFFFLIAGCIAIPQYLYTQSGGSALALSFHPGYLVSNPSNLFSIISYWFYNLGFHIFLIPIGIYFATKLERKLFIVAAALFIVGNLFQFSPEIAANHKFFNLFMLIGSMFTSLALVRLWEKKYILRPFVVICIFFLMLSGIIDFFPIYNDSKITLADYTQNEDIAWIMHHTPRNAIFFNTNYLYDDASLAGRKIFLGWPYFAWSAGYDTQSRSENIKSILASNNKDEICSFLSKNNLSYVSLKESSEDFPFDKNFWTTQMHPIYTNSKSDLNIFARSISCSHL